ncbi:MAG: MFS transporter [Actinomycetes bacterium]
MAATDARAQVSRPLAIALLGWIGAIKATGASLATVAIVDATKDLGLSPAMRTAAASTCALALAATVMATGVLADRVGRRRVLMWSYLVASVGSLLTLITPGGGLYLTGQALAGVGFGAMFSGSYAYVKKVAPGHRLGWALGLFGAYASIITAIASISGGFLADYSWRALFAVVPIMCAVAFVATPRLLPEMERVQVAGSDWLGLVVMGAAMVAFLDGISQLAREVGPISLGLVVLGIVLFAFWVLIEKRGRYPAFPLQLFASRVFLGALIVGVTFNVVQAAATLGLSNIWQYVDRERPLGVTLGLQPFYVIGIIGALVAGRRLSAGTSPRLVIAISCLAAALGFVALAPTSVSHSYWMSLPAVVFIGIGMMAGTTAQSQVFVEQAPAEQYGSVTASRTTVGQLGFALGFGMSTVLLQDLTFGELGTKLSAAGLSPAQVQAGLTEVESYITTEVPSTNPADKGLLELAAQTYSHSFTVTMLVAAGIMLASAAAAWLLMRVPRPGNDLQNRVHGTDNV